MAEETTVASSSIPPTSAATETEVSQQENGTEAADVSTGEHTSEPEKGGADQAADAEGTIHESYSDSALRLISSVF